ncbi:MAG: ATP-binding protein [Cyanobacteria bacterium P01_G01_bin.39]
MTKILILEANPQSDIQTSDETRDIQEAIKQSRFSNSEKFEVRLQPSTRSTDLHKLIHEYKPDIIHFCGHGTENDELQFRDIKISKEALIDLFRLSQEHLRCVVLNSCFSEQQARQVVEHIDFAIGMKQAIRDDAAIAFAIGFYQAIGYGESYERAFLFGCNAIQIAINNRIKNKEEIIQKVRKLIPIDDISISESDRANIPEHKKPAFFQKQKQEKLNTSVYCNLPQPDYPKFIGREEILRELLNKIDPEYRQHITVVEGIGGVGKTALVLEASYRCLEAMRKLSINNLEPNIPTFKAIIFTSAKKTYLTSRGVLKRPRFEETLQEIFRTIADILNQPNILMTQDFEEQLKLVRKCLSQQTTLLIIDNMETISRQEQEKVISFLDDLPLSTQAIVTSRERIGFHRSIRISELSKEDSLKLIKQEAKNKAVKVSDYQAERFYSTFGGVPIALIYAVGQRAIGYNLKKILGLRENQRLPKDLNRFLFERSVKPLREKPAHRLLLSITFFQSPPSYNALITIAGLEEEPINAEEGLATLQQLSLVSEEEGERYSILPITHKYALDELAKHKEFLNAARTRWVNWYIEFTKQYGGKDWDTWRIRYDYLALEWENIASVLYWCAARDKYEEIKQIWLNIDRYVDLGCYWRTRRHWWAWLISKSQKNYDRATYVRALSERAWTLTLMGDEEAENVLNIAWEMKDCVDLDIQAHLANHIAVHRITQMKYDEALEWLKQQEQLVDRAELEEKEHIRHQACISYYRAEISYWKWKNAGDKLEYNSAKKLFKEVYEKGQVIKWQRFTNYAQNWLADLEIIDGTFDEAEKLLKSGLHVAEISKERRRIGHYNASYAGSIPFWKID